MKCFTKRRQTELLIEFEPFIEEVKAWAEEDRDIEAVILVGSYARGDQKPGSDIDLVILTASAKLLSGKWLSRFGCVVRTQMEYYGAVTSVRVWYENGMEVEFGIAMPEWLSYPLDEGTRRVLKSGYRIITDREGRAQRLKL